MTSSSKISRCAQVVYGIQPEALKSSASDGSVAPTEKICFQNHLAVVAKHTQKQDVWERLLDVLT